MQNLMADLRATCGGFSGQATEGEGRQPNTSSRLILRRTREVQKTISDLERFMGKKGRATGAEL